jgi:hypothetical protein
MVYSMGITKHDVRHTVSTLRDYGNISSGAFLLAFERLQKEACVKRGDFGMFVTMCAPLHPITHPLELSSLLPPPSSGRTHHRAYNIELRVSAT